MGAITQELLTLGHGTATAAQFAELVRDAAIESIVDVRTVPKSRRHLQFWREEMERWVPETTESTYRWEPALGGFRKADRNSDNVALRHPSFRAYADYMETDAFAYALSALLASAEAATTCSRESCSEIATTTTSGHPISPSAKRSCSARQSRGGPTIAPAPSAAPFVT